MPTDFVTYLSSRDPGEIIALISTAAPDDELGLYRLFGGRAMYVSSIKASGFALYRTRIVNRMPATMIAKIEPSTGGGSIISTWFEPRPGWREAALDIALALAVVVLVSPTYAVPAVIAVATTLAVSKIMIRRAWERDRRATREFVTGLLHESLHHAAERRIG